MVSDHPHRKQIRYQSSRTYINKFVGGPRASEEFTSRCGGKVMNIGVGRVNSERARSPKGRQFCWGTMMSDPTRGRMGGYNDQTLSRVEIIFGTIVYVEQLI